MKAIINYLKSISVVFKVFITFIIVTNLLLLADILTPSVSLHKAIAWFFINPFSDFVTRVVTSDKLIDWIVASIVDGGFIGWVVYKIKKGHKAP